MNKNKIKLSVFPGMIITGLVTGLIFSLMALPFIAAAEVEQSFSDVTPGHTHFDAIEFLKTEGIIGGYEDGSFQPEGTINRAEAMKLTMLGESIWVGEEFTPVRQEVLEEEVVVEVESEEDAEAVSEETIETEMLFSFPDIASDVWFKDYVYNAYDRGIVRGYEDGSFKPGNNITKAESLKIILLVFTEGESFSEPGKNPFPDTPFSAWYAPYVNYAKNKMIIEPDQYGNYSPESDITRGEFAEIVYRLLYMAEHEQEEFDPSINWEVFNRSLEGYTVKIPPEWETFDEYNEHPASGGSVRTIFWNQDQNANQRTYMRQYPNSAVAEIFISNDPVEKAKFFSEIRSAFGSNSVVIETTVNDMATLVVESSNGAESLLDSYLVLPDGRISSILGTYGAGPLAYKNAFHLRKVRESFTYTERSIIDDSNITDVMTIARQSIQVDGKGMETLKLFDDLQIIETDTIGVGTGPVDYYFSAKVDHTLKHERSFDVILDIEVGSTSGF
ncbi:S-layer homology domain-containing protein [Candidatus Peregrinibacteria bacterium]|jgi:hypothetical protein|nr:S-layer homology domain-containing protein [Candidatus Peregrinibacteria bacterium]